MASIYKKGRDKGKKGTAWYFDYTDHEGKRQTERGFTDKGLTEQLAAKREHEVMLRRKGLVDPEMEKLAQQRRAPIEGHLVAYEKSLSSGTNTPKHIGLTMSRVRKVVARCSIRTIGDIRREKIEATLSEWRKADGFGLRTHNHYLQATNSFCRWLVATRRLAVNPLAGMKVLNAEVDIRHKRRALSPDEFAALVDSARSSGKDIQCYDGETRAAIYIVSYMTGLRRSEIASLTSRSFALDVAPPTLTVQAASSKHRRLDVLPLHPDLVEFLRDWLSGKPADEPLFPKLAKRRTWLMVQKDLERVGIPYETHEGIADFHAAGRHSHITGLMVSGASLPEAQRLARHSDIRMTMRYTHIGLSDQAEAVGRLPCQWIGSVSGVAEGHSVSLAVTDRGEGTDSELDLKPLPDSVSVAINPDFSQRRMNETAVLA